MSRSPERWYPQGQYEFNDDPRLRTMGVQAATSRQTVDNRGAVADSWDTFRTLVGAIPKDGGTVWLAEGVWQFYDNFSFDRNKLTIRGVSPTKTILRRASTKTNAMLTLSGDELVLENMTLEDAATATSAVALKVTGSKCCIRGVYFKDGYDGLVVNGGSNTVITNCRFAAMRNNSLEIEGTSTHNLITGCSFEAAATGDDIYLGDDVSETGVIANVLNYTSGTISHKAGNNNTVDANVVNLAANVTVR